MGSVHSFALVEMLTYIAVFAMVSSLIFSIYNKCSRVALKANYYVDVLSKVRDVSGIIEKDIRSSSLILPSVKDFVSSDSTLILKISSVKEDESYHVIYRFDREEAKGFQRIIVDNQSNERVSFLLTKDELKEIAFRVDRTMVHPLVGVDLTLREGILKKDSPTFFSFSASLRNTGAQVQ